MNKPVFALLTDFGNDFAVASIRGVILTHLFDCTLVDVDHSIEKFNLVSAAFVINKAHSFFPPGTIFLCIVDPGVGSQREAIYLHAHGYHFFGPNNGIFHYLIGQSSYVQAFLIDTSSFDVHSNTFHGRDLFAPAAISFAQGNRNFLTPLQTKKLERLSQLNTDQIITFIDSFGNIKTNISYADHDSHENKIGIVTINNITAKLPITTTFSNVPKGQLLGYRGSNDTLEIATNLGSAAKYFQAKAGDQIKISLTS